MTPEQIAQVEEAKKRIRSLFAAWVLEGNPAGAFTEVLRTVEGFGLHWGAESGTGDAEARDRAEREMIDQALADENFILPVWALEKLP